MIYLGVYPKENDGKIVHKLAVKDAADGVWSISLYNAKGISKRMTSVPTP
jgi:hypothetical protein